MKKELDQLKDKLGGASSSAEPFEREPQKGEKVEKNAKNRTAAKTAPKPKAKAALRHDSDDEQSETNGRPPQKVDNGPPDNWAARQARLRRVCERKPSGRIQVPLEVHERWKMANSDERTEMAEELEAAGWSKDYLIF